MTRGLGQCEYCGGANAERATACSSCGAPLRADIEGIEDLLAQRAAARLAQSSRAAAEQRLSKRLDRLRRIANTTPTRETAASFSGALLSVYRHPIALGVTFVPFVPLIASPVAILLIELRGEEYQAALHQAYWIAALTAGPLSAVVVALVVWRKAASRSREAVFRHIAAQKELARLETELEKSPAPDT